MLSIATSLFPPLLQTVRDPAAHGIKKQTHQSPHTAAFPAYERNLFQPHEPPINQHLPKPISICDGSVQNTHPRKLKAKRPDLLRRQPPIQIVISPQLHPRLFIVGFPCATCSEATVSLCKAVNLRIETRKPAHCATARHGKQCILRNQRVIKACSTRKQKLPRISFNHGRRKTVAQPQRVLA